MNDLQEKKFTLFYWILCVLLTVFVALRCWLVPFAHDEVATFLFYIQPGDFLPFTSHPDANGHFLTSALGWVSFKCFGSSPFALRLPSLFAFVILCYAVFRTSGLLRSLQSRLLFISAILFSFNFISFYSLCRGYGLSMAFLLLSLFYFFRYLRQARARSLIKFMLFSQIALSANLTLVMVLAVLGALLILYQIKRRVFFKVSQFILWIIYFGLLFFWVKYAFFLKNAGALYYGGGENYWQVTFQSLIEIILFRHKAIEIAFVLLFAFMLVYCFFRILKGPPPDFFAQPFFLSLFCLAALIGIFYLLKILMNVNYPEDRTGLFFYLFFVLALVFMVDNFREKGQLVFSAIALIFVFHFVANFNLRVHCWRIYETMPVSFFDTLRQEQKEQTQRITVGGHRVREFIFGFMNYNSPQKLNHMTSPEALQMNCDYALAYDADKPFYDEYYSELASDSRWGFRLIKRRNPVVRSKQISVENLEFNSGGEYYNFFEVRDTSFSSQNPLLCEVDFQVNSAPLPFNAWLVLQVDAENEGDNIFVRVPLNLVRYDWSGKCEKLSVVTGNIPVKIKRLVAYLWNIDKATVNIKVNTAVLFQLSGEGITEISKAKI